LEGSSRYCRNCIQRRLSIFPGDKSGIFGFKRGFLSKGSGADKSFEQPLSLAPVSEGKPNNGFYSVINKCRKQAVVT
jgi:hypothetical protein